MLTCFISAPAGVNLSKIKKILVDRNLKFIHPSEIPFYGQSISKKISELISQADIFIAIFDESLENGNTLFELGMAVARKKQIIILTPPKYDLPSDLSGFLSLKVEPDNIDALGFAIDQLLAAPIKRKEKREIKSHKEVSRPLGNKINELRNRLKSLDPRVAAYELENFVADMLKESGISIIQQSNRPGMGADFAIWSNDLEAILGNPILVEIERSIKNHSQVRQVTNRLFNYMQKSNSKSALVLYLEGLPSSKVQEVAKHFNILFFQIGDFIEQLQDKSFADAVRIRRNIFAHGGDV